MKHESFDAHPLWTTLDKLQSRVDALEPLADAESRYAARRLHAAIELVDTQRVAEPVLLEQTHLDDVNNHLTQVSNHLKAFLADRDASAAHLPAASDYVVNVVNAVRAYFVPLPSDDISSGIKGAATRYKNSLDDEINRLQSLVDDLQAKAAASESVSDTKAAEFSAVLEQEQAQVAKLSSSLQAQIDQQSAAFESATQERQVAFTGEAQKRQAEFSELTDDMGAQHKEFREDQEAKAEALLDSLTAHETQAASLVDTTSRHATSGDYKTWASIQARIASVWTIATVVIGLGVVIALVYFSTAKEDSLNFTLTKFSITAVGLIVAGYAARQASEHRKEERIAKKTALDLDAIEPFLLNVDDPNELRTELAKRVFFPDAVPASEPGRRGFSLRRTSLSLAEVIELLRSVNKP